MFFKPRKPIEYPRDRRVPQIVRAAEQTWTVPSTARVGKWDGFFDVIRPATEAVARYGRCVSLVLKADLRPGRVGELDAEVERLDAALGEG